MAKKKKVVKPNTVYEFPDIDTSKSSSICLGLDPGSKNHGISIVGLVRGKIKIYANSVLMTPLNDLVDYDTISESYLSELDTWVGYGAKSICAERFQVRSFGGPLVEYVGVMLGLLKSYGLPVKLTIASTWKNKVNKRFGIDLKEIYPTTRAQPHQLDAALIGIYGLEVSLGKDLKYTIEDVINQVERTSLIPLKKERR